jgi:hypothetical protein
VYASEFPRIEFAGNSSRCIKLAVEEGQDLYFSLPVPIFRNVLPFQPKRSALPSLGIATGCSAGRILMHAAA